MKLFLKYLKQQRRVFILFAVFACIFVCAFSLYRLPLTAVLYPMLICTVVGIFALAVDFLRVKKKHEAKEKVTAITDIVPEMFGAYDSIEECDNARIACMLCDEYNTYKTEEARKYAETLDYYTTWAHQIKTPIASMRLQLQGEDTPLSRRLTSELARVEQYAEMVMTFLRLNSASTDYVFKNYELDGIVKQSVKRFSSEFIGRKLSLAYEPLCAEVVTDEKWLSFVIEQVLSNALKYTPSGGSIRITLEPEKTLRIRDTGIGIAPEDLPRVFEKGYTGFNGRTDMRASGIGLYLCRRICDRLGHGISVTSELGKGTAVDIDLSRAKIEIE